MSGHSPASAPPLRRAARGSGQLVVLSGEAGIGKTWLAGRVAERAREQGFQVGWAACPADAAPAYWPWRQLLRALRVDADGPGTRGLLAPGARPPTSAAPDDSEAARLELYEAVADILRAAAAARPLLAVIKDVHWADAASLRLLGFLVPGSARLPAAQRRSGSCRGGLRHVESPAGGSIHSWTPAHQRSVRGDGMTDAPFTDPKEVVAGFYVVEAADPDTAVEIARRNPVTRMGGGVEVRPVARS